MSNNTKLLCLFLRAQKINKSSEQGYAMAMVSLLTIILFSLLAASLVFSNLAKSRTDAFVDSNSSFAVAESGLNKRAVEFKAKLESYSGVTDISAITTNTTLASCFGEAISPATPTGLNELGCRNYSFESSNSGSRVAQNGGISLGGGQDKNTYVAYTKISKEAPQNVTVMEGDYAGLNAAEYKYVISSTAKKPNDSQGTVVGPVTPTAAETAAGAKAAADRTPAEVALVAAYDARQAAATVAATNLAATEQSSSNLSLSVTFTKGVISLFQFAVFYEEDLEFNSTSAMQLRGRVHSNANIYTQPAGDTTPGASKPITTFLSKVSAFGDIYNRVDAWTPGTAAGVAATGLPAVARTGITRILLTGSTCPATEILPSDSGCRDIPTYDASNLNPLTATQVSDFSQKILAGVARLNAPSRGFARKRSYATNKVGEYFSKADMRLEFVPDRSMPFNFTAITTAGTGACSTDTPAVNTTPAVVSTDPLKNIDPVANYVDPNRESFSTLKCNQLKKGQLQSLRQPVMVLTTQNQTSALADRENTTLNQPTTLPTAPTLRGLNNTDPNKNRVLRALQVALVSSPTPISIDQLSIAFNNLSYVDSTNPSYDASLNAFRARFSDLLDEIFPTPSGVLSPAQQDNYDDKQDLLRNSPNQIAALRNAWFLPAPIQRVGTRNVQDAANNTRNSGFYDGREQRWISVLQTNIASLAVWNRDGLYVPATNETMTSAYASSSTDRIMVAAGTATTTKCPTATCSTNGLAFVRSNADSAKPVGSLQYLGLGSTDSTEGGLILQASVSDDLDGNNTIDITRDTTRNITRPETVNGVKVDVIVDHPRIYPGVTGTPPKSPFAFAFTGGDYLPNSLLLSTDQAVYLQGNFNNNNNRDANGTNRPIFNTEETIPSNGRLAASVIADTITVLSNDCVTPLEASPLGVPGGQLNCGIQNGANVVTKPTVINAAFLSNTDKSNGNIGRGYNASSTAANKYSGGVNNYIRLLEDWNNGGTGSPIALNYMGSMISLGEPLEYSGLYRSGGEPAVMTGSTITTPASYYNIPFRNFNYDPNFSDVDKMPPLTPKAFYIAQKNFSRKY